MIEQFLCNLSGFVFATLFLIVPLFAPDNPPKIERVFEKKKENTDSSKVIHYIKGVIDTQEYFKKMKKIKQLSGLKRGNQKTGQIPK